MATKEYGALKFRPKRLLKLAEVLENFREERKLLHYPVKRFNLKSWGHIVLHNAEEKGKEPVCGTSACAFGTAGLHPWFRKRGLDVYFENLGEGTNEHITRPMAVIFNNDKEGYSSEDFDAIVDFFGIESMYAFYIFDPTYYKKRKRNNAEFVAKRIRKVVKRLLQGKPIKKYYANYF